MLVESIATRKPMSFRMLTLFHGGLPTLCPLRIFFLKSLIPLTCVSVLPLPVFATH